MNRLSCKQKFSGYIAHLDVECDDDLCRKNWDNFIRLTGPKLKYFAHGSGGCIFECPLKICNFPESGEYLIKFCFSCWNKENDEHFMEEKNIMMSLSQNGIVPPIYLFDPDEESSFFVDPLKLDRKEGDIHYLTLKENSFPFYFIKRGKTFEELQNMKNIKIVGLKDLLNDFSQWLEDYKKDSKYFYFDIKIQNMVFLKENDYYIPKLIDIDPKYIPKKSIFNKIVGDSHFELQFADFLEECDDIISYAKNYFAVHFKIDYKNADGEIKDYYPDFFVKVSDKEIYIVETKGREDLDDIEKIKRLYQWCSDINSVQNKVTYTALYVKQDVYEKYTPNTFNDLIRMFAE